MHPKVFKAIKFSVHPKVFLSLTCSTTQLILQMDLLATIVSFLDINDFQDCDGTVVLCDFLDLSIPERQQVLTFWSNNSVFEIHVDRVKTWFTRNRKIHNTGPAVLWNRGTKEWFSCGERHRGAGNPAIEWRFGKKDWYLNGVLQTNIQQAIHFPFEEFLQDWDSWFSFHNPKSQE